MIFHNAQQQRIRCSTAMGLATTTGATLMPSASRRAMQPPPASFAFFARRAVLKELMQE
jgi:hypothetical protein